VTVRSSFVFKVLRAKGIRLFCILGFGLALTACDRCGDFASPIKMQVCREQAPPPSQ
jgi:recombinational DNA repair protein (RecF pathway)